MYGGGRLRQKVVRWGNLFLVAILENPGTTGTYFCKTGLWHSQLSAFSVPASLSVIGMMSQNTLLCGHGPFNLRGNSRKSHIQFSTCLFSKRVTGKCSVAIKLYPRRKGTGSWIHMNGKIYNGEKKRFVKKSKTRTLQRVSFLCLTPSNLLSVCSSLRNSVTDILLPRILRVFFWVPHTI